MSLFFIIKISYLDKDPLNQIHQSKLTEIFADTDKRYKSPRILYQPMTATLTKTDCSHVVQTKHVSFDTKPVVDL